MSRSNCGSSVTLLITLATLAACTALAATPDAPKSAEYKADNETDQADSHRFEPFKPESVTTSASVTIAGRAIPYQAAAGTLIVHPKGWDDVPRDPNADKAAATSSTAFTSQDTWSMPRTHRCRNCTTTSRTSSAAPAAARNDTFAAT